MLLAEDPLALLIDRLRAMSTTDRRAILSRLTASERRRVEAALATPVPMAAPCFAADIMACLEADPNDTAMTPAARDVLLRIAGPAALAQTPHRSPSLFVRLGDAFRRG